MNKLKKLIIEIAVTLSPLWLGFVGLELWLSGIFHNSVMQNNYSGIYDGIRANPSGNVWVAFDYAWEDTNLGYTAYNWELQQVLWIGIIITILLVILGKSIHFFVSNRQFLKKRQNMIPAKLKKI